MGRVQTVTLEIILRDTPLLIFALSFSILSLSAWLGVGLRKKKDNLNDEVRRDLDVVSAATLTLLGLIIGFSFSMAVSRYDQRKNYEEEEANAIGTEYLRLGLLPAADTAISRDLLIKYLGQRILFYEARDLDTLKQINQTTAQLQTDLWNAVQKPAGAQPTANGALALSGMNDVLNTQGYTQASWWNRIPFGAWILMGAIAIIANLLMGFGLRSGKVRASIMLVLPLLVSIAFLLIADIDSPRGGMIRMNPINLIGLSRSLHGPS